MNRRPGERGEGETETESGATAENVPLAADDPFGDDPAAKSVETKPKPKPTARAGAEADNEKSSDNPFGGPPPKGLRPFGKPAVPAQKGREAKPAARSRIRPSAPKPPLRFGEKAILKAMEGKTRSISSRVRSRMSSRYLQDKHGIPIKLDTKR